MNKIGKPKAFPVVAIGASAGGLKAFEELLNALPREPGMAFVLVPHLSPQYKSHLAEILARNTKLSVREVQGGDRVAPNRIYVLPPNRAMQMNGGALHLSIPGPKSDRHNPIDRFFRSLAGDQKKMAVGVLLSGEGSDGTEGLRAIKEGGGRTFAQNSETAAHLSMPHSAVVSGCVDFVLSPAEIAKRLGSAKDDGDRHRGKPQSADAYDGMLELLQAAKGIDFKFYKQGTLRRRIKRRMTLSRIHDPEKYLRALKADRREVDLLYADILICVTSFFREPESFRALKSTIYPRLLRNMSPAAPIRIWVAGCSMGEEAYSHAMNLVEFLGKRASEIPFQIFATDVNPAVIEKARAGLYFKKKPVGVSAERLRRFFVKTPEGYRIAPAIRERCVFSVQNLVQDTPFTNMDLISCRNLLIYLGPSLQEKVMQIFQYALKPRGVLMLGRSETVGDFAGRFSILNANGKIFAERTSTSKTSLDFIQPSRFLETESAFKDPERGAAGSSRPSADSIDLQSELEHVLPARYVPNGVIVNADLEILQFLGNTSPYLRPAPGKPSLNLRRMASASLLLELRAAIHVAKNSACPVRKELEGTLLNGALRRVRVEVVPIKASSRHKEYFLIIFEDIIGAEPDKRTDGARGLKESRRVIELKEDLAVSAEHLKAIIEEQESTNARLKSSNEDLLSSNEELQSINEEFETTKEELQSSNEELITSTEEVGRGSQILSRANSDLSNLLANVDIPIVLLDPDLSIHRFTPSAEKVLGLSLDKIGRSIMDVKLPLSLPNLKELLLSVNKTGSVKTQEVQDTDGRWYYLILRPYRTDKGQTEKSRTEGVVMALVDIQERKLSEKTVSRLAAVVRDSNDSVIVINLEDRITGWNKGAQRMYGYTEAEALGKNIGLLLPKNVHVRARDLVRVSAAPIETRRRTKDGRIIDVLLTVTVLRDDKGQPVEVAKTERDITVQKRAERDRKLSEKTVSRLAAVVRDSNDAVIARDLKDRITAWNKGAQKMYGYTEAQALGMNFRRLVPGNARTRTRDLLRLSARRKTAPAVDLQRLAKDGRILVVHVTVTVLRDEKGEPMEIATTERDITEQKRSEKTVSRLATVVLDSNDAVTICDLNDRITAWNKGAQKMYGYTEAQALGMSIRRLMPKNMRLKARDLVQVSAAPIETRRLTKDGRTLDVLLTVTVLRDEKGELVEVATTERDITEHKRAERVRKLSEKNVLRLANSVIDSNDGVIICDLKDRILAWNKGAQKMYGYTEAQALGMSIRKLMPEDKLVRTRELVKVSAAPVEIQRRTKSGRILDVRLTVTVLRDEKGRPVEVATTERDITEQKRSEKTVSRLATVVLDSNDAVTVCDLNDRITAWNKGAQKMYGYTEKEALGTSIRQLMPKNMRIKARDLVQKSAAPIETQRLTKDGRTLDVLLTVTVLRDEKGEPVEVATTERDITEQKRSEKTVTRLATVVLDSNDAVTICDLNDRITAWNKGAQKMYGYTEKEALGTSIRQLMPKNMRVKARDLVQVSAAPIETQRLTKDGRTLDVLLTVTVLRDEKGELVEVATTERDITAYKQAERVRKLSEKNVLRLANSVIDSNDAVTVCDLKDRITAWNKGARKMYGYTEKEALGMSIRRLMPENMRIKARDLVQKSAAPIETQRLTKDGRTLDVLITVTVLRDEKGKPVEVATTERDITEQKRSEKTVTRLATVVLDSNDAVTVCDLDDRITAWNKGAQKMYGYTEKEALGTSIRQLMPKNMRIKARDLVQKSAAPIETQRLTKDGRTLDVLLTVTVLRDEKGELVEVATTERDITAYKQAERVRKLSEKNVLRLANSVLDSNDGVIICDLKDRILAWNKGAQKMYGYTEAQALGMSIRKLMPEDKLVRTRELVKVSAAPVEIQRRTKSGRILDVRLTVTVLRDDKGRPVEVATTERDITEQKRSEKTVSRLATVVLDSNDAVTVCDLNDRITAWNKGAQKMYGYTEAQALGMSIRQLMPKNMRIKARDLVQKSAAPIETQRLTKDGRTLDVLLTVTVLRDEKGELVEVATTERDITAYKQAERVRKLSEKNVLRLANSVIDSNDGVIICDLKDRILAWNKGAQKMYGYTEAQALGMSIRKLMPENKLVRTRELVKVSAAPVEIQRRTKSGRILDVRLTVTVLRDDKGRPVEVATTERDITEQKRSEKTVSRLATVVLDSNDAVTVCDLNDRITAWNKGAQKMYGYTEAQALGMNIRQLMPENKLIRARELVRVSAAPIETQRLTKDGRTLDVMLTVTVLRDDKGRPVEVATTERDITEQKRSEKTVTRLATVVLDSNDAVTVCDLNDRITAWNKGAQKMYGYTEAQALGMSIRRLMPKNMRLKARDLVQVSAAPIETQRLTKDGRTLDVLLTVTVLRDEKGELVEVATTERDITEHKRAERERKLSEKNVLRLANSVIDSNDGVIICDLKDRIIAWNKGAQKMYGYTEAQALGMSIRRLMPENKIIRARELVRVSAAPIEAQRRTKDGRLLDVMLTVTVLRDDNGEPVEVATTERDITEQKRAERERKLSEKNVLRLANSVLDSNDGVIICDLKDRIIAWNKGAQKMYGYTEAQALGMNIRQLMPENKLMRARELVQVSAAPIETQRRTKSGRLLDVMLTVTVLRDEKGEPVEVATTERDITEQKRADQEFRRLHASVISAQETERKRLARELHDGVGQILSGVKFRLQALPGKMTLSGGGEAKILKVGGFLDHAIAEIRRVSQNLMPSELVDLGLGPALSTLCREFKERSGIHVTLRDEGVPAGLSPDLALAFFRISQEALNNIGKYSKATMVVVALSLKGKEIVLSISDNGVGFNLGGPRQPAGRGFGLGNMRQRAESVGGSLEIHSTPGAGTTLNVRAPLSGLGGYTA